ncbi:hypothetical protein M433DRAFT_9586 [Acidomyces richmondensis BFW]|nr:hypothetical protein M433DRAFT_9586 [Acidomyces richmondensis BFW]
MPLPFLRSPEALHFTALATYTYAPSARRAAGVIHRAFDSSISPETRQNF